jgi:hypothetical protein
METELRWTRLMEDESREENESEVKSELSLKEWIVSVL